MQCEHPSCTNVATYIVSAVPAMSGTQMSVCDQHVVAVFTDAPPQRPDVPPAKRWSVGPVDNG